jgi:hypothetical protein
MKFNPKNISRIICRFQKTDYLCNPVLSSGALPQRSMRKGGKRHQKIKTLFIGQYAL